MNPVLEARGLAKSFADGDERRAVIRSLDLTVGEGEIVAVMGPSGAGKSTLLNLLAGMVALDAGTLQLHLGGETVDVHRVSAAQRTKLRRRHIGYVFQFFNLVPTLTVRENVLLPLELNGLDELAGEALARLSTLGLDGRLDDFPAHLSGGERQRTAIARALAHRPRLVLADEPTGNLDQANAERVIELLIRQVRALPCALVMATHSRAIAERADRVVDLGRLRG
ncbi:MAG TPA: ABC transporter ATP-binding protein [Pseudomonadales bacterium]